MPTNNKIRIGWFTFSCCEDNTVIFTELLNDHWKEWKKLFDFRHVRVLQSKNVWDQMDVAFVEGALASAKSVETVKKIRSLSTKVVAVGACACIGMPSAQRNTFNKEQEAEIQFLLDRFKALPKVLKVSDAIKVDAEVPGCPMNPDDFVAKVTGLIKELRPDLV